MRPARAWAQHFLAEASALVERSGDRSQTLSYQELWEYSRKTAALLRAHGVRRGDVVGVWLPNWIESVVLEFALAALGAAVLGINTRYGVNELSHLLRTGPPVGIIVPDTFHDLDFTGRLRQATTAALAVQPDLVLPWVATVGDTWRDDIRARTTHGLDIGGGWWQLESGAAPADVSDGLFAGQPATHRDAEVSCGARFPTR